MTIRPTAAANLARLARLAAVDAEWCRVASAFRSDRPEQDQRTRIAVARHDAGSRSARRDRRHPLFGEPKGLLRVMSGTDFTKPAHPEMGAPHGACKISRK
jgi:hypothetical protein